MFKKLLLLQLCLLSATAHADFISTDWQTLGDQRSTLDTETGIEWLNLNETKRNETKRNETKGWSVDVAETMTAGNNEFNGWRVATAAEANTLMANYFGYDRGTLNDNATNYGGTTEALASSFVNLFG